MYVGKTLFAQVMEFIPWTSFDRIVRRHGGNAGVRSLSCAEQFRAMAFAQLTWRESLRDIEASLSANSTKLYAMGFRSAVKRSTLADANESRNWLIWSDLAAVLIRRDGALTAIASAVNALERGDIPAKCKAVSKAASIIDEGLRDALDMQGGGQVAAALQDLYSCILMRLTLANARNDAAMLRECSRLLLPMRDAWISIRPQRFAA